MCPLRGQSLESRLAAQRGVMWAELVFPTWARRLTKFLAPLGIVVILGAGVYDRYSPWPPAMAHLSSVYPGEWRFSVGDQTTRHWVNGELARGSYNQRSYILLPSVFFSPRVVSVSEELPAGTIHVEESVSRFMVVVFNWCFCLVGTWYFWIRPARIARRSPK